MLSVPLRCCISLGVHLVFGNIRLRDFDTIMRAALSTTTNCNLDDAAWDQASLYVKEGGLGIRNVAALAPSAFLASAASTRLLQASLLPASFQVNDAEVGNALSGPVVVILTLSPPVRMRVFNPAGMAPESHTLESNFPLCYVLILTVKPGSQLPLIGCQVPG